MGTILKSDGVGKNIAHAISFHINAIFPTRFIYITERISTLFNFKSTNCISTLFNYEAVRYYVNFFTKLASL